MAADRQHVRTRHALALTCQCARALCWESLQLQLLRKSPVPRVPAASPTHPLPPRASRIHSRCASRLPGLRLLLPLLLPRGDSYRVISGGLILLTGDSLLLGWAATAGRSAASMLGTLRRAARAGQMGRLRCRFSTTSEIALTTRLHADLAPEQAGEEALRTGEGTGGRQGVQGRGARGMQIGLPCNQSMGLPAPPLPCPAPAAHHVPDDHEEPELAGERGALQAQKQKGVACAARRA